MGDYADLEIILERLDEGRYSLDMRFTPPGGEAEVHPLGDRRPIVELSFAELRTRQLDPAAYGQYLTNQLFTDQAVREALSRARAMAQGAETPLRLRLALGASANELHAIRWETLRDPDADAFLLLGEQILFSRYLSSNDWSPVRLRPEADLHAVVAISNPSDLDFYSLSPVDTVAELELARVSLGEITLSVLATPGSVTRDAILSSLRDGTDILYLICHGRNLKGETWLWLEDEQGTTARIAGSDLVQRLRDLENVPRLAVLMACQSAGEDADSPDAYALSALGPRLSAAGVPAVLAVQGNISMETASRFMAVFFERLRATGQVDRAAAAARGAVRDRPDAWAPLLYTRIRSGRIWAADQPEVATASPESKNHDLSSFWISYSNVDIELFDHRPAQEADRFRVRVVSSPKGGQSIADAAESVLTADLRERLRAIAGLALDHTGLVDLGKAIADLLFPPIVRELVERCRADVGEGEALRLRLKIDARTLAALPWEYAYLPGAHDDAAEGFLGLDRKMALVRHDISVQPPRHTLAPLPYPLAVVSVVVSADIPDLPALVFAGGQNRLRQALKNIPEVDLATYENARVVDLEEALNRRVGGVHFASQIQTTADGKSAVLLLDDQGQPLWRPAETLALNLAGRGVRLVVLEGGAAPAGANQDWNALAWEVARAGIPAVLVLPPTSRDSSAITFLRRFYRALVAGQPIEAAVTDGRLAVLTRSTETEHDWGAPVLTMGGSDGTLFPSATAVREGQSWDDLLTRARSYSERFLREARGGNQPGLYMPETYVPRTAAAAELAQLLHNAANGLALVGDSGNGKTSLLCDWTEQLLHSGNAAFLFNCASLPSEIAPELARALVLENPDALDTALQRIAGLAEREGRRCALIFDGINFAQDAPVRLLRQLDALVGRLPSPHIVVVFSCNSVGWAQLERQDVTTQLSWSRYHQTGSGERVLRLGGFTSDEFVAAYERYRAYFQLLTPLEAIGLAARERLGRPLLLRMLAEGYRGRDITAATRGTAVSIFGRYFDERVKQRRDILFVDELAAEMLRRRAALLPVDELARNATLRDEILSDDSGSSYARLLDNGILTETPGDVFQGDMVHFTYGQVGGYALARHLLKQAGAKGKLLDALGKLARESAQFALGWDTARIVLLLYKRPEVFIELARSAQVEARDLAVDALVELYAENPVLAIDTVSQLIQLDSEEARWAGLKAAYYIGPGAQELFLWSAMKGSPALRQAAKVTLYLIWHSDSVFPYRLLNELVSRLTVVKPIESINILEFVIDLSVTIYMNHPENQDVVRETNDLHYKMCTERLRLQVFGNKLLDPVINVLIRSMAEAFSRPIMNAMLLSEAVPAERYFALPAEERASIARLAPFLDPARDLRQVRADLVPMFNAEIPIFCMLASLVMCVHAYTHFDQAEPLLRELWDELSGRGRIWLLVSFSFLVPDTPTAWTPLLEELTQRISQEHADLFDDPSIPLGAQFDILLLPLALAYGKQGREMPLFATLIADAMSQRDNQRLGRIIAGLAVVGYYYPQAAFKLLRTAAPDPLAPGVREALVHTLATIRTRHLDLVDGFLSQIGADDALRRAVCLATDPDLVRRYVILLGLYNNAVHFSAYYPVMRDGFGVRGLTLISEAPRAEDFVAQFTQSTFHLGRDAEYRFTNWTRRNTE